MNALIYFMSVSGSVPDDVGNTVRMCVVIAEGLTSEHSLKYPWNGK